MELFKIGFVTIRLVDIIDISVVTFLFYKLYELLRGSIAIRLLTALLSVFLFWKLVDLLDLVLLKSILDQFLGVGAIALIIIFAGEIRRFLLLLGKNTIIARAYQQIFTSANANDISFNGIVDAIDEIRREKLGALIVITGQNSLDAIKETGDRIGAKLSQRLLHSIFLKESPLHDGAVIIDRDEISAARCVLPLSSRSNIPAELGLRHRSALGISEQADALVIVVSEERNQISLVREGKLQRNVDLITLEGALREHYNPGTRKS
ncbi:MAG: diadenylate cyclase CdaA [Bacteroidota bacterium]